MRLLSGGKTVKVNNFASSCLDFMDSTRPPVRIQNPNLCPKRVRELLAYAMPDANPVEEPYGEGKPKNRANRNPLGDRIDEVVRMRTAGATMSKIAKRFGVSTGQVSYAIYQHLGDKHKKKPHPLASRLNEIRRLRIQGLTYNEVAQKMGVSSSQIAYMVKMHPKELKFKSDNPLLDRMEEVYQLRSKGLTYDEVAKELGATFNQVFYALRKRPKNPRKPAERKDTVKMECTECGGSFLGTRRSKYCSANCSLINWRRRQ